MTIEAMTVSVIIPAYNSERTIKETLDSVLRQTAPPNEIFVLDDGSTDDTVSLVNSYRPRVTVFQQPNKGVANARNTLLQRARGNLIAFLDHDDLWHRNYLEVQSRLFAEYPKAAAFFTGHVDFYGYGNHSWSGSLLSEQANVEVIEPLSFVEQYNKATGHFASMSYCCIPKRVLSEIGTEPFSTSVSGADDFYLFNLLPLLGPVIYCSLPLVAYRIIKESQSANLLKSLGLAINALELLEERYRMLPEGRFCRALQRAFASKRRQYAKTLMVAGNAAEARRQLRSSLRNTGKPVSIAKSLTLLLLSYIPAQFQPRYRLSSRESEEPQSQAKERERSTDQALVG